MGNEVTFVESDAPCDGCGRRLGMPGDGKIVTANVLDLDPTDGSVLGEEPMSWHEKCAPKMVLNMIAEGAL